MTTFYAELDGTYIGGFDGATGKIPAGKVQVPFPPDDARSKWDGTKWLDPVLTLEEKESKLGVTPDTRLDALWQFIARGDSTLMDELKLKEDQAKI